MDPAAEQELQLDLDLPAVFAVEHEIILRRSEAYSAVDPFPEVPAALLSTSDLLDYAAATGMIHPFRIDMADYTTALKPASYGVPLLGEFVYWERSEEERTAPASYTKRTGVLAEGDEFTLLPNTIAYVTLEPHFRFPRYIAARFNLNIRDIYRGILVGTGPLVDPGFDGPLSVPLHNLTSNTYTLVGGEPLVWMEFTKLGGAEGWRAATDAERPARRGFYVEFPPRKRQKALDHYLRRAHPGPIVSSIPTAVGEAQAAAESARADAQQASTDADRSRRTIRNIAYGGAVAAGITIVIALVAILVPTWNLINDANSRSDRLTEQVTELEARIRSQRELITRQSARIQRLETAANRRASRP